MSTFTSRLATVGLAAIAVGAVIPTAAVAAPTSTSSSSDATAGSTFGIQAAPTPSVSKIVRFGDSQIAVNGVAVGATTVQYKVAGGSAGVEQTALDRFSLLLPSADLGKVITITAYGPGGKSAIDVPLEVGVDEGATVAPNTPVVHAVSSYDDETLVIEGTITYDPALFDRTEVHASVGGMPIYDVPDQDGSFTLRIPVELAGETVDVQAFRSGLASAVVPVELVETAENMASKAFPLNLSSPAAGSTTRSPEATFVGSGVPGSHVVVTRDTATGADTATLCETNIAASGDWTCTSPTLPAGVHRATITESPVWASAEQQKATTAFFVADDSADDEAQLPELSSVSTDASGWLVVRGISNGASMVRLTIGEFEDVAPATHGRFAFRLAPGNLGATATITGIRGGVDGRSLTAPLSLRTAPAPSPLAPPRVHGITQDQPGDRFQIAATTSYFAHEWEVPSVIALVDGTFVGTSETSWNGALYVTLDAGLAGKTVEFVTVRGTHQSARTTVTLAPTERNSAPETFPLEVTSIAEGAVAPIETAVVAGTAIPGSTVSVAVDGVRADEACAADVLGDGTWSCTLTASLTPGARTMTVTETPYFAAAGTPVSTRTFTVGDGDGDDPEDGRTDLTVTSHADGGRYSTGIATFSGRGTPDSRLTAANQWGTPMGSTRVDEDGDWSFTRNLGPTSAGYDITFTMTPPTGAPTQLTLHLDYEAPARPLTVTSHVDGESYREGIARFTGTGTVGAQLVSTNQWGTPMGKATIGSDGTWAFSRNLGPTSAGYVLTFVATHGSDEQRTTLTLTHQKDDLVDVRISSPVIRDGGIAEAHRTVTFRGTATPFATVVGKNQWGTPFGSTIASSTGAFAFDRYVGPAGTTYQLTFEQKATDGTTKTTTGIDFVTGR
ncbi:hypothetical protein [Frigoribacterium sp. 2355]